MNMNFNLNLTQEQKLIMSHQMQLSISLLQMSSMELQEHIDKEVEENPVLEFSYDDNDKENEADLKSRIAHKELIKYLEFDSYSHHDYQKNEDEEISQFSFVSEKKSLKHYLNEQLTDFNVNNFLKKVCKYIIDNLDDKGYLDISINEIAEVLKIDIYVAAKALNFVQTLDPSGIAARDLKECLKLQLERRGIHEKELFLIIDNYLEDLAENRYVSIAKSLGIDLKKAQQYGDVIKSLQPKPSSGFYTGDEIKYIVPDAYIRKIGDCYHIIMNDDLIPKLCINNRYKQLLLQDSDKEAVNYIKDKLNSALFLIKSIEQRKSTIYRVLERVIELQKDYFDYGESGLRPMTLKDISQSIEMHESTVSRAIKDKYINTNRGTIKIKDLFTAGISTGSNFEDISTTIIKKEIKELINKEDKSKPLSDQAICEKLNEIGMNISRRTVAKYREEMNIKASSKRRRF